MNSQAPRWSGHKSETRAALLRLLMRAATGHTSFTFAERAFVTAWEFWAAAYGACLTDHRKYAPLLRLQQAHLSFCPIRAVEMAGLTNSVAKLFTSSPSRLARLAAIHNLEQQIQSAEPIDQLLSSSFYFIDVRQAGGEVIAADLPFLPSAIGSVSSQPAEWICL